MVKGPQPIVVGTTAVRAVVFNSKRTSLAIANLGTATVFFGLDATLTVNDGFPIPAGAILAFSLDTGDNPRLERWLISGTAGQDVRLNDEFAEA